MPNAGYAGTGGRAHGMYPSSPEYFGRFDTLEFLAQGVKLDRRLLWHDADAYACHARGNRPAVDWLESGAEAAPFISGIEEGARDQNHICLDYGRAEEGEEATQILQKLRELANL
jgi:hypothetical protein